MTPALGHRIRTLRRRLGWTLKQTAVRCGCTESLLSKVETGKVTPAVATLARVAKALGVSVSALLADDAGDAAAVFNAASAHVSAKLTDADPGYRFFAFAAGRSEKLMQPLLFEARRGEPCPPILKHDGEEFIFVLEGRMAYCVGDQQYTLGPGDSLYFDAWQPHGLSSLTPRVRFLAVFVEPTRRSQTGMRRSRHKVLKMGADF